MLLLKLALSLFIPLLVAASHDLPDPNGKIILTYFNYTNGVYSIRWALTDESPGDFDIFLTRPGHRTLTLENDIDSSLLEFTGTLPNIFLPQYQLHRRDTMTATMHGGDAGYLKKKRAPAEIYWSSPAFVVDSSDDFESEPEPAFVPESAPEPTPEPLTAPAPAPEPSSAPAPTPSSGTIIHHGLLARSPFASTSGSSKVTTKGAMVILSALGAILWSTVM